MMFSSFIFAYRSNRSDHDKRLTNVRSPSGYQKLQQETPPKKEKIMLEDKLSVLAYCLSSMTMTVANKYLLVKFPFSLGSFILAVQVGNFCLA
jgi:hypothetical protein